MRLILHLAPLAIVGTSLSAAPAVGAARSTINVPASSLGDALLALGRQAHVNIGANAAEIVGIRVHRLSGSLDVETALRRLLAGTGFGFVRIDSQTFRIIRVRALARAHPALPRASAPPAIPGNAAIVPIVVTGSKRSVALNRYPATVDVVDLQESVQPLTGASGSGTLLASLPMLASTQLGRGRNKLFIRGVADSSFTGPTQATVGQYLGEVRLNYNAPDPDLSLYDIARVEVIEGPQGTLYGAGTLGGVLRLVPNAPELDGPAGSLAMGISETRRGSPGYDVAGMANVPLVPGLAALRVVGYQVVEGGYIRDLERGLHNINRMRIHGLRTTARIRPGDGWTIDVGSALQWISTRDSQYADLGGPSLSRRSAIAQPFDNDYQLWHATVRKAWRDLELVSATGFVRHDVTAHYDATPADASRPIAFVEDDSIHLLTHETRLSRKGRNDDGWVVGVSLVDDVDRVRRSMGPPGDERDRSGIRNSTLEASLFGEMSIPLTRSLAATVGGRLTFSHLSNQPLVPGSQSEFEPARKEFRALPTFALAWHPDPRWLVFSRFQEGFRAGGLSISDSAAGPTVKQFKPDRIRTIEAGVRYREGEAAPLSASATVSYANWRNIQADLIEPANLPSTANIGNGQVYGLELSGRWQASAHLTARAAVFLNNSTLTAPAPGFETDVEDLPNIARAGITGIAEWHATLTRSVGLGVQLSGRYVGKSQLGVGPGLDLSQGDYFDGSLDARLSVRRLHFTVGVTNLANAKENRFALGNPFGPTAGRQATPLRPRTVRLGVETAF